MKSEIFVGYKNLFLQNKMSLINLLLLFSCGSLEFCGTSTTFANNGKFTISSWQSGPKGLLSVSHSSFLSYFLITQIFQILMPPC